MVLLAKTYGWMLPVRSIKQRLSLLTPGIGSVCRMDVLFRNILSMQGLYPTKKVDGQHFSTVPVKRGDASHLFVCRNVLRFLHAAR